MVSTADEVSRRVPLVDTITGSTIRGGRLRRRRQLTTTRTTPAEKSMPVFTAAGGSSSNTASICCRTRSGSHRFMGTHGGCYFSGGLPGRAESLPHGAMVLEPLQIAIARLKIEVVGNPFHGPGHLNGLGFHPAMPFAMAIGEADHPAPVVLRRR